MTTRRRFAADFKARVALEALRGDKTIQEIAARHKVHPNQVSTWNKTIQEIAARHKVHPNHVRRWTGWGRCFRTVWSMPARTMNPKFMIDALGSALAGLLVVFP